MLAPSGSGDPHLTRRPAVSFAQGRSCGARSPQIACAAALAFALTSPLACSSPPKAPRVPLKAAAPRPSPPKPAPAVTPPPSDVDVEVAARLKAGVEYGDWQDMGGWVRYMAPKGNFLGPDGEVDVAFQFHGAEVAEKDWRQSGLNAVVLSVTYPRWGTVPYKRGFSDPVRFGVLLDEALKRVGATRVRRLLLVSWSAGYAAMGLVLGNAHYYSLADTAVILDGLHADYIEGKPDERPLANFERFARDAVAGRKTMVVVHSSIVPNGYASTTQMAELLCASVGAQRVEEVKTRSDGLVEWYHSDAGSLHVRGYRGDGPKDHLDQLHLLDDLIREHVTPRWTRLAVEDEKRPPRALTTPAALP